MDKKEKDEVKNEEELTEEEKEALKDLEEELVKMLDKEQLEKDKNLFRLLFGYALHKNFLIHSLLMIFVNIFTLSAIIGLTTLGSINNYIYYFLSIILFTFVEINLRLVIYRFFPRSIFKSLGMVNLIYLIPTYYLLIVFLGKVDFKELWHSIIVLLGFIVLRIFITYYIKVFTYRRKR